MDEPVKYLYRPQYRASRTGPPEINVIHYPYFPTKVSEYSIIFIYFFYSARLTASVPPETAKAKHPKLIELCPNTLSARPSQQESI